MLYAVAVDQHKFGAFELIHARSVGLWCCEDRHHRCQEKAAYDRGGDTTKPA